MSVSAWYARCMYGRQYQLKEDQAWIRSFNFVADETSFDAKHQVLAKAMEDKVQALQASL